MEAHNINVPIEEIYADIMENNNILKYNRIELEYHPPEESFQFFPNWGKKIREAYYTIGVWGDGFGFTIQKIKSNREYLFSYSYALGGRSKEQLEFTENKINELKDFFKNIYKLDDEDIIIESTKRK
jgi:hypothetical protein